MKAKLTIIPKISIHPDKINLYNENHWDPHKPTKEKSELDSKYIFNAEGDIIEDPDYRIKHIINSKRKSNGIVSRNAAKKMIKATDYLLLMAKPKGYHDRISGRSFQFKIAFITLTLPAAQFHDDKTIINQCLNQFLIEIRKYYKVKNYVWRAEKQKNGNIHFHLLIDKFIPYQELRNRWNRILSKLGYIEEYRKAQLTWHKNGFRPRPELFPTWSKKKQFEAYQRGSKIHWSSPNTTDIHSVRKIRNIKRYLIKYVTKQETHFQIKGTNIKIPIYQTGRLWGCNHELSNITGARSEIDSGLENELQKLIDSNDIHKYSDNYYTVIYIDVKKLEQLQYRRLFELFASYLYNVFGFPLQTEIAA